jgi:hypothetical protein
MRAFRMILNAAVEELVKQSPKHVLFLQIDLQPNIVD